MLGETTDPAAVGDIIRLCGEIAFVTNKLFTLKTDASPEQWEEALKMQFTKSPHALITTIKPKPSIGGRPWASCATTKKHAIAAAKDSRRKYDECTATINIQGPASFDIPQIIRQIISQLPLRKSLQERTDDAPPDVGEWSLNKAEPQGDYTGGATICFEAEHEIDTCRRALENKVVEMGSCTATVEIVIDSVLAKEAKNSSRRGGGGLGGGGAPGCE